jgi:phosphoribosylaminoimidazole carboxylase (NCAIR synthetase)
LLALFFIDPWERPVISRQIANALDYVGVVAVEIFVVQGNGGPKVC